MNAQSDRAASLVRMYGCVYVGVIDECTRSVEDLHGVHKGVRVEK